MLMSVTIPNSVTNMGNGTFESCSGLTNVTVGSGATSIGNFTFGACACLTSITIPDSVASIGYSAFAGCTNLTSVSIGSSVTSIGSEAFYGCYVLTNIVIPNSVTGIEEDTFRNCISLVSVTIPSSVTSIGNRAFYGSGLTSVYFQGNAPMHGSDVFSYSGTGATVYYLPGTTGWGTNFDGLPTSLWTLPYPLILNSSPSIGVKNNAFAFNISWATNLAVVVEECTNLLNPVWRPLQTNILTNGTFYFSDPQWTNYSQRYYRISAP